MNDEKIWFETEDGKKLFIIKTEKCDMQKELTETIDYLQKELQRKDNNWNELKKWLEEKEKTRCDDCFCMSEVLDKIKELNSRSDE